MLANLSFLWLAMAFACVTILSFIIAVLLNALVGEEAFGATGNAAIMTCGFFAGIVIANSLGYRLTGIDQAIKLGVSSAFVLFALLVVLKGAMRRLFG